MDMTPEHECELIKIAPILYQQSTLSEQETCMCWGFECPDSWFDLLKELSFEIENINKNLLAFYNSSCQAVQVKEKFGELRFYYDIITNIEINDTITNNINLIRDQINELINKAELKSTKICAYCRSTGY